MTCSIPLRVGASFLLRSKHIIPQHPLLFRRYASLGTVSCHPRNNEHDNVSTRFFCYVTRKHSTTTGKKLHQKILLPQHGQNGTLLLLSSCKSIGQVDIIPQWRDDTMLELIPVAMSKDMENNNKNEDKLDVKTVQYDEDSSSLEEQQIVSYGGLQFTLHRDGIATALGREGSLVEVDVDVSTTVDDNSEGISSLSTKWWKLVATVPEKSNITCNIVKGNINVISKLEGDSHLSTSDGDIKVSKLRGHDVTLNNSCVGRSDDGVTSSPPGLIYVQKGIEAQTVRISSSNRVRARMVNGSDVSVRVEVPSSFATGKEEEEAMNGTSNDEHTDIIKLDEDDAGFRIDIGSLYISGSSECEAVLCADDDTAYASGLIRVKSSHGHVMAHAKSKQNASLARLQPQTNSFVDLGGVNGSCDVTLEVGGDRKDEKVLSPVSHDEAPVTTRVHFDSLSPDSISTITSSHSAEVSDEAIVSVTVDRKVEADVRLLSLDSGAEMSIDMDRLTSDDLEDVETTLLDIERCIQESGTHNAAKATESISIETEAFDAVNGSKKIPESDCFQYKQGTIRNRSGEPDSRFDIRSSPSRGKINIDSAASQALSGFQGKTSESDSTAAGDNLHLPLLAVSTNGKIKLETLSWLGAIARRYGLEGEQELGRTASRKPRLS